MTPFEKTMVCLFCRKNSEIKAMLREYRHEMYFGGGQNRKTRLKGRVLLGYVFMVGMMRTPVLYLLGFPLALFLYSSIILTAAKSLFNN